MNFNSEGFRDREFQPKDPDVWRIVVVGDSFSYGHGLPETESYPRQLEVLLRQRLPGVELEVFNAGVGGGDLKGIAPVAEWALNHLAPDVLVYGYFLNDPLNQLGRFQGGMNAMLDARWLESDRAEGALQSGRPAVSRAPCAGASAAIRSQSTRDARNARLVPRDPSRRALGIHGPRDLPAEGSGGPDKHRVHPALAPHHFSAGRRLPAGGSAPRARRLRERRSIQLLDILPRVRGYLDSELMLHPNDRHPNSHYARIVAEALADAVSDEFALPRAGSH